jgi:glycosyltransferase involved in cell wall biosynthesis
MTRISISALHIRPGKCGSHEPYLVNLLYSLSLIDRKNQYLIFVNPENKSLFKSLGPNFELIVCSRLTSKVYARILYEQVILPFKILIYQIDVAHFPGNIIPIFHPFNTIVTIHTDSIRIRSSMDYIRRFYYDNFLRINRNADLIIVPTESYAKQLVEFYSYEPERMVSIHHGCSNAFFDNPKSDRITYQQKWGIEKGAILSVTNTLPHKNLENFLKGIEKLRQKFNREPQIVLVGYIDEKVLNQYVNAVTDIPEQFIKRIHVIPYINNEDMPEIYRASSYFVFPSKEECFGMPIIEAFASEVPCAISDIPAFREVAGEAAMYFDPENTDDIANKIEWMISNNDICENLIRIGKEIAQNHTWKETAKLILSSYQNVLSYD